MSQLRIVIPTEIPTEEELRNAPRVRTLSELRIEKFRHAIRVPTLSEEYNSCSPTSKAIVKAFSQGVSPTSKPRLSVEFDIRKMYSQGDDTERSTMAHYGMVSYEYHLKNKHVEQKRPSITSIV
jgi:hypothetical protein